jgi:PKD repeat protein
VVLAVTWAAICVWAQPSFAASVTLTVSPQAPIVGQTVTMTAVGVPDDGADPASYRWDFDGDGSFELNTGLVPTATTTYTDAGTYTPTVQFRDTFTNRVNDTKSITVTLAPPIASFIVSPAAPLVNQPVQFISTASDPDGVVIDQAWDLNGDGLYDNGSGPSALRSFGAAGQYVVGLRATDNDGNIAFNSQTVTVSALPGAAPVAPLRLLNPFPVVRFSGSLTKRGAKLKRVAVSAPSGTTVRVGCKGRSCPYRNHTSTVSKRSTDLRLSQLERRLRAGVRITIYITSPGTIGKYTSFTIRRGEPPRRVDRCVNYGSTQPFKCQ